MPNISANHNKPFTLSARKRRAVDKHVRVVVHLGPGFTTIFYNGQAYDASNADAASMEVIAKNIVEIMRTH